MNYHQNIMQYGNNIEPYLGHSVKGKYFKGSAYIRNPKTGMSVLYATQKSDTYFHIVQWVNINIENALHITVSMPLDSDDLANRHKLKKLNDESELFLFILSPRSNKFSLTFFSGGKESLLDSISPYFPEGEDITYSRSIKTTIKSGMMYCGTQYEIQFNDMFYLNMIPFFSSRNGIEIQKVITQVNSYEDALDIIEQYKTGV